jgi:hypothetical protein
VIVEGIRTAMADLGAFGWRGIDGDDKRLFAICIEDQDT